MMLHRHFEGQKNENITKLEDVTPKAYVSEVFLPTRSLWKHRKSADGPRKPKANLRRQRQ